MSWLTGVPYPDQSESPRIAFVCDVSAAYLRTACADPSAVVSVSKSAVAAMVSAHAAAPLLLSEVAAAAAVPGVVNVRGVTINANAADDESFAGCPPVVANIVDVAVFTIA